jgi:RimJ/RimL family protein N-acetyltransferase
MCSLQIAPRIETERLVLRRPQPQDAVYVAELANDPDVARMTTSVPHPYRLADAQGFLARTLQSDDREDLPLLVEHREVGPIGMVGLHRRGHYPELGYWLGRTFRGRGFATEAVRAVLDWTQREQGRRAILSSHFVDNAASARVLHKAGFLYTGDVEQRFSLGRGQLASTRMMVWLA